jgi:hypothetical protein
MSDRDSTSQMQENFRMPLLPASFAFLVISPRAQANELSKAGSR